MLRAAGGTNAAQVLNIVAPDASARPPAYTDNTTLGYSSSTVWQEDGQLYKPVAAPDATQTAWQIQPTQAGAFTDIVGTTNTIFAGGLVAMKAGYTGNAIDISATVNAGTVTATINILATGELDVLALQAVMARADAGTLVTVTKLYDQSGAGNHYVKDVSYPAPIIEFDPVLGRYALCGMGNTATPRCLKAPAGVAGSGVVTSGYGVVGNSYAVYIYGRGVASSGPPWAPFALGDMVNATVPDRRFLTTLTQFDGAYIPNHNGSNVSVSPAISLDSQPCVLISTRSTTTQTISVNEDIGTASVASDTAVFTSGWLGMYNPTATGSSTHRVVGFAVSNLVLTAAQSQALRYSSYTRFDIKPQVLDRVYCIGDSRTWGALPATNRADSMPLMLSTQIGKRARVYSFGNSGYTSAQMTSSTVATAIAQRKAGAKNVAVYWSGVNDFIGASLTPAQSMAAIQANTALLKAAGFKVVLVNEIATTSVAGSASTNMPILRGLINAAGAGAMNADVIVDPLSYTPFQTASNTTYYADGLHPTPEADMLLASLIAVPVKSALNGVL